jgi:hypothetical protein
MRISTRPKENMDHQQSLSTMSTGRISDPTQDMHGACSSDGKGGWSALDLASVVGGMRPPPQQSPDESQGGRRRARQKRPKGTSEGAEDPEGGGKGESGLT